MQLSTLVTTALAPMLGPLIWKALHLPGKIAAHLIWKYMPYGRLRTILLRESDPFAPAKPPFPQRSAQAQRARRPR